MKRMNNVDGVSGANGVSAAKEPKEEQRVVEPKGEQVFSFGSEGDIGDGLTLLATGVAAGEAIAETLKDSPAGKLLKGENPTKDVEMHSAVEAGINTTEAAGETLKKTPIGRTVTAIKEKGIVQATKDAIHNMAEDNRKFKEEHPVIGTLLGFGIEILDKIVN